MGQHLVPGELDVARLLRVWSLILFLASPGCAALSLFSQQHTHTHHHHYDSHASEVLSRMESIEQRIGSLEVGQYPVPGPIFAPSE